MSEKLLTEARIQKIWSGIFKEIPGGWSAKMIDYTVLCELRDHIAAQQKLIEAAEREIFCFRLLCTSLYKWKLFPEDREKAESEIREYERLEQEAIREYHALRGEEVK